MSREKYGYFSVSLMSSFDVKAAETDLNDLPMLWEVVGSHVKNK